MHALCKVYEISAVIRRQLTFHSWPPGPFITGDFMKTFTLSALRPVLLLLGLLLAHTSFAATDKIEPALRNVLMQQSQADFLIQLKGKADLAGIGQNISKA